MEPIHFIGDAPPPGFKPLLAKHLTLMRSDIYRDMGIMEVDARRNALGDLEYVFVKFDGVADRVEFEPDEQVARPLEDNDEQA